MNEELIYEYMVDIDLPVPFNHEFISLIPKQREVINQLMKERRIENYAVSIDDGKLWVIVLAESESHVEDLLISFPIINHVKYRISKLTFHNSINFAIPQFSLN